ncbi:MAG: glutamate--tRNA ligase [Methylobacteriaceae bacterium]|jgi:glutamyl-tRNA synthetase|nr:glutamate--tRNA ligase [Methylobacteriaceae bacterium]
MKAPVVRFAPSPTGNLHIGNARTALFNALFTRSHGGVFILRFDDTDLERSRQEFADGILTDLQWLGIHPDTIFRQSDRFANYDAATEKLKQQGLLYACYETAEELDRRRKFQVARGLPPIYDRAGLKLSDAEKAAFEAQGRRPHWRFLLAPETVAWKDLVRGDCQVDSRSLSDPVLIREDGSYLYTLPSVVDDIDYAVTHIIRGEDHVTNTAVQIQIFRALGAGSPAFAHHNLLTTVSGEGLSKRLGHLSLRNLRESGYEPMAVASLATLVGSSQAIRAVPSLAELGEILDFSNISRAPAKFDPLELDQLNARLLHEMPYDAAAPRLKKLGITGGEAFWNAVRANIVLLSQAREWWHIVSAPIQPSIDDPEFIAAALALLPEEPWDTTTWKQWTSALAAETGRKGKTLYMPLRQALTGIDHGPELAALLPIIGRSRAAGRLQGKKV